MWAASLCTGTNRSPAVMSADTPRPVPGPMSRKVPPGRTRRIAGPGSGMNALSGRSEEHTSELQSLMRISYAVFCLKKKKKKKIHNHHHYTCRLEDTLYTNNRHVMINKKH